MRQAFVHLSKNGIIIVTTYFCYEHRFVQDFFENEKGATVYMAGLNPSSYPQFGFLPRDNYLIVVGKSPKKSDEDFSLIEGNDLEK